MEEMQEIGVWLHKGQPDFDTEMKDNLMDMVKSEDMMASFNNDVLPAGTIYKSCSTRST